MSWVGKERLLGKGSSKTVVARGGYFQGMEEALSQITESPLEDGADEVNRGLPKRRGWRWVGSFVYLGS